MRHLVLLLAVLVLSCATACGGGGGDATPATGGTPATGLVGTYFVAALSGVASDEFSSSLEWGFHTANGATIQGTSDQNAWTTGDPTLVSTITTGLSRGPDAILSGSSGRVVVDGLKCFDGGISPDGDLVALASSAGGDAPAVCLMARPGPAVGDAALFGAYHIAGISHSQSPQSHQVIRGTANFDGAGGGTVTAWTNTNGTISAMTPPLAMTYSLATPGRMTFSFSPATFEGALIRGSDVAVLAGDTTTATAGRALLVLIRESTAADLATFSGRYRRVDFAPRVGTGWESDVYTMVADGLGTVVITEASRNGDGLIFPLPSGGAGGYSITPGGLMQFGPLGPLSRDGQFAALAYMSPGNTPRLAFLVRSGP